MKVLIASVIAVLLASLTAASAQAYSADVGNRAQDFGGWDIVGQRSVHLDDYLGQWVLVDFWGSWCGPCRAELPNLIKETTPYRRSGKLALISVACDSEGTLPDLHRLIREHGIDYSVIYDGGKGSDNIPASEWGVDSWPSAFLVNPQGVIMSNRVRGALLEPSLKYFIDEGKPGIGLSTSWVQAEDGGLTVTVLVCSPDHAPIEFSFDRLWETWQFEPTDPLRLATDTNRQSEPGLVRECLSFSEFGEWAGVYTIPVTPEMDIAGFRVVVTLPGTEQWELSPKARGIRFSSGKSQAIRPGIEFVDGHWRVRPDAEAAE